MKLINNELGIQIEFQENKAVVLVIESPYIFAESVCDLLQENDEEFVLIEAEEQIKIQKEVEIITDPFRLELNSRKVLQKLYKEWSLTANEMMDQKADINAAIIETLNQLQMQSSYGNIRFELELSWEEIFKAYQVRFENEDVGLLERLIAYIKIMSGLLKIRVVCFVNLKCYLTTEQLRQLYQMAFYCKMYLLLLETRETVRLEEEKVYIIDNDRCLIVK